MAKEKIFCKTFMVSVFFCYFVLHRLLYSVLPVTVANELRHQRPVAPKRYVFIWILNINTIYNRYQSSVYGEKSKNIFFHSFCFLLVFLFASKESQNFYIEVTNVYGFTAPHALPLDFKFSICLFIYICLFFSYKCA